LNKEEKRHTPLTSVNPSGMSMHLRPPQRADGAVSGRATTRSERRSAADAEHGPAYEPAILPTVAHEFDHGLT
jgi:hypothetical protein